MRRPLMRLAAVGWAIAAAVVAVAPGAARADAPQQQGWWSTTNPGGLPANPTTAEADVPSDGLLVQGGPASPTASCNCIAYAGLVYELTDGTTASDLTLKVAPNSATTPVATLKACALTNLGLQAEQGGPMTDAPDYDCKRSTTASLATGNSSVTFHVGSLVSDGILAIAILPADSTSRVVFSKPDSSSLVTTLSTSGTGASFTTPSAGATSASDSGSSAPAPAGGATAGQPAPPSFPQQSAVGGTNSGQTPVVAPSPSTPASTLAAAPVASTSSTSNGSKPVAVIILVAGLAVGAMLWAMAGRDPAGDVPAV